MISPIFVSVNLQIFAQNVFQTSVCICACVLPKYFSYICVCVSYYKCYFNIANSLLLKLFSTRGFNRRSRNFYNGVKIYILTKSLVSFHLNSKHLWHQVCNKGNWHFVIHHFTFIRFVTNTICICYRVKKKSFFFCWNALYWQNFKTPAITGTNWQSW